MIKEIKNGNETVFRDAFSIYSQKLYHYLLLKARSEYLANEVTQLTFIKLWKYRQSLSESIPLSTQVFQIAKTTLIDELRKEERRKTNLQKLSTNENIFKSATENVNADLHVKDLQVALDKAIDQLPPVRRKVFQMSRQEQLSHKEISNSLSISIRTVDKHIQLALQSLKPVVKNK
jgi:RNA polymerase sigma-70 factor (ECF subfamily)